jgi:hypothetical protein
MPSARKRGAPPSSITPSKPPGSCRNGGEYYTPRPLIRAIIQTVRPDLGQTIYDGALGSAGFLCEAYDYLRREHPQAHHHAGQGASGKNLLRQREKKPGLRDRDHEHDRARHRSAEHHPHQHAGRESRRCAGKKTATTSSWPTPALRRKRTRRGPAEFPHPHRRNRLPVPPALHQAAQGRRPRRRGDQEHVPLQHRQRQRQLAEDAAGIVRATHDPRLPRRHVPRRGC